MSDKENMWDDFSKIGEAMAAREKELDEFDAHYSENRKEVDL